MTALASSKLRFKCPICESIVERQSRTQVYCSPKCMRKGNYARKAGLGLLLGQHTALIRTPIKSKAKTMSCDGPRRHRAPAGRTGLSVPGRRSERRSSIAVIGRKSSAQTECEVTSAE
jgi:hypothetical protein